MNEHGQALEPAGDRPTDELGRVAIAHLTDREIAEETLAHLRSVADALMELQNSPMFVAMRGGGNPLLAMMRG